MFVEGMTTNCPFARYYNSEWLFCSITNKYCTENECDCSIVKNNMIMEKENMKSLEEEIPNVAYAPYIPVTNGMTVNGIRVWDRRWYVNIFCKINWFFHFKERKRFNEISKIKVKTRYGTKF